MKKYFRKNGLVVLDFDRCNDISQGRLKVCHAQEGLKFYRIIPTQENYWVHIAYDYVEPLYGCKVVDFRNPKNDYDTPVYLVYLSDIALLKCGRDYTEHFWGFKEGELKEIQKEWLMYYNLIPGGVSEREMVIEPPQIPEDVREILLTLLDKE
jgi:hypothetical protein